MARTRTIGLILSPIMNPFGSQAIMEGIGRYGLEHGHWRYVQAGGRSAYSRSFREVDGWIVLTDRGKSPDWVRRLRRAPVLRHAHTESKLDVDTFSYDDVAIGRLAAQTLLDRGFRHLRYHGFDVPPSHRRWEGFSTHAQQAGRKASTAWQDMDAAPRSFVQGARGNRLLRNWIRKLPLPAGIFAFNDGLAADIIRVALGLGVQIPDDLALIGVDNNLMSCRFGPIPISSVDRDDAGLGYRVAQRLDARMQGQKVPHEPLLQPPRCVIERLSTEIVATEDELVSLAVQVIRERACEELSVENLLEELGTSRTNLEKRFRRVLGLSPHQEIRRVRLRRVRQLLQETTLPLVDIAVRSGFHSVSYLCRTFRAEFGRTPGQFRRSDSQSQLRL